MSTLRDDLGKHPGAGDLVVDKRENLHVVTEMDIPFRANGLDKCRSNGRVAAFNYGGSPRRDRPCRRVGERPRPLRHEMSTDHDPIADLARPALTQFAISPDATVALINVSENHTCRVEDPATGTRYALRLDRSGYRSTAEIESARRPSHSSTRSVRSRRVCTATSADGNAPQATAREPADQRPRGACHRLRRLRVSWLMYDFATTVSFMEDHPRVPELREGWSAVIAPSHISTTDRKRNWRPSCFAACCSSPGSAHATRSRLRRRNCGPVSPPVHARSPRAIYRPTHSRRETDTTCSPR
jgi:hypothetical protein